MHSIHLHNFVDFSVCQGRFLTGRTFAGWLSWRVPQTLAFLSCSFKASSISCDFRLEWNSPILSMVWGSLPLQGRFVFFHLITSLTLHPVLWWFISVVLTWKKCKHITISYSKEHAMHLSPQANGFAWSHEAMNKGKEKEWREAWAMSCGRWWWNDHTSACIWKRPEMSPGTWGKEGGGDEMLCSKHDLGDQPCGIIC